MGFQCFRQYIYTRPNGKWHRTLRRLSEATWMSEDTTFLRIVEILIAAGGDPLSLSRADDGRCHILMEILGRQALFLGPLELLETILASLHPQLKDLPLPLWDDQDTPVDAERMPRVRRLLRQVLHHALLQTARTDEDSAEWETACAEWENACVERETACAERDTNNYVDDNPLTWWRFMLRNAKRTGCLQNMDVLQSVLRPAHNKRIFLCIFFEVYRLGNKTISTSLYRLVDWVYRHHNASGMAVTEHSNAGLVAEKETLPSPSVRLAFALCRRMEHRWLFWIMSWVPEGELELWRHADENGNTLLHVACDCRGRLGLTARAVAGLVERGWDPWRRNGEGMTALDLVRRRGNHHAESWLLAWASQTQTTPSA